MIRVNFPFGPVLMGLSRESSQWEVLEGEGNFQGFLSVLNSIFSMKFFPILIEKYSPDPLVDLARLAAVEFQGEVIDEDPPTEEEEPSNRIY